MGCPLVGVNYYGAQSHMSASTLAASEIDFAVEEKYSIGAVAGIKDLCCPADYDPRLLEVIPRDVVVRDYGCGDLTKYVRPGDTVMDLGSGSGKFCFIASQLVGPHGKVIGIDRNEEMLALARSAVPVVASRISYCNVEFKRGQLDDLRLDLDRLESELNKRPVASWGELEKTLAMAAGLRERESLIADHTIDLVVSNCVFNLVPDLKRKDVFSEMFRVLRSGGRFAISDIVSDEPVPEDMTRDPELWAGCVSGAHTEMGLIQAIEEAGFENVEITRWPEDPWKIIRGIEFRSVTVVGSKREKKPCMEGLQAVIFRGPWKQVVDDGGHTYRRGERVAVCVETFNSLTTGSLKDFFIPVEPYLPVPPEQQSAFDCSRDVRRHPHESKNLAEPGSRRIKTADGAACCVSC